MRPWMALSGVITLISRFSFDGQLRHSDWRQTYNVRIYICQLQSSTFGHNEPTLQLSLSAIAELLVDLIFDRNVSAVTRTYTYAKKV